MGAPEVLRHSIRVRGTVQGVGFRPTVYRIAKGQGLAGWVRNDSDGVWIEIEGPANAVLGFPDVLRAEAPPLSRIDAVDVSPLYPTGEHGFRVVESRSASAATANIPADAATCDACLRELFDPHDRRHRYPFINCTDCGPRYTIIREVPYDRAKTTMDPFSLCAACRAEYEDPGSRRFHAEPNACPDCGPRVELVTLSGASGSLAGEAALQDALARIAAGEIVAVKGLGGFFLAVDARNEAAVARLRERKRRPHKPFALMAKDLAEVDRIAAVSEAERLQLCSPARPIVLLARRAEAEVAPSVAPGLRELGVMLPYSPLHHLLVEGAVPLIVLTSGNVSEEPIARTNEEALARLSSIADAFLLHDREIHTRADDSVVRVVGDAAQPLRRARGFVPVPLRLPCSGPPLLAVGAELKSTVCLTRGREASLSQHLGDLKGLETFSFFTEVIDRLGRLLDVRPTVIAHDLHPDYRSTRWAEERDLPRIAVQHHHAHLAACLAEHGRTDRVIGIAFDGTGCGPRGELWGGEFLLADLRGFYRFAHLRPIALPGGEAAIREPWRLACAALFDAGVRPEGLVRAPERTLAAVMQLLERNALAPRATGAGRWFDALSALCGVREAITYEGQAAIELEALAASGPAHPYPFEIDSAPGRPAVIDLRPIVRAIAEALRSGVPAAEISARVHETLARAALEIAQRARTAARLHTVALSGGCFQNRRLTERISALLSAAGFEVLTHHLVPPNDGGIAFGQAAIATWQLSQGKDAHVPRDSR